MSPSDDALEVHERQVKAVTAGVAKLLVKLGPDGFSPEAIFEGSIKGAAVQLIAAGATVENVAEMLDDMAQAFRELEQPTLRVVQ